MKINEFPMNASAKLYSLTSVTLNGTIMLIPAIDFEGTTYPFDLHIILPEFMFSKNTIDPFLKFLHFINFHYVGKLTIASMIKIDVNNFLDELYKKYLKSWRENAQITILPERRRIVEQEIVRWTTELPKSYLSEYIKRYYSSSVEKTDWKSKISLWKSLRKRSGKKKVSSKTILEKLREKYVEVWFKYMDKTEFSLRITKTFPTFIRAMNQLTFKEILQELRICPVCEADLTDYPSNINFCSFCGSNLAKREDNLSEADIKFCAACGYKLRPGINFCNNCGKKIERE